MDKPFLNPLAPSRSNPAVKSLPSVAGTRRKRRAPYYSQNQIFLSQPVADAIRQVNQELVSISNVFIYAVELAPTPDVEQWFKITEKFEGSVKEALSGLEKQLRQLLGDES